jgi:ribosome maturation factor RimP
MVADVLAENGCELWELRLAGPRGRRVLQVFADSPVGVDVETTSRISRTLRRLLDDPQAGLADCDLEVSSPGAERPLRGMEDYVRYVGRRVHLRFRSGDSETVVEGPLVEAGEDALAVQTRGGRVIAVPLADLLAARGAVDFGSRPRAAREDPEA